MPLQYDLYKISLYLSLDMLDFETLKRRIFLLLFLYKLKFNYSMVKLKRVLLVNLLFIVKLLNFLLAVPSFEPKCWSAV